MPDPTLPALIRRVLTRPEQIRDNLLPHDYRPVRETTLPYTLQESWHTLSHTVRNPFYSVAILMPFVTSLIGDWDVEKHDASHALDWLGRFGRMNCDMKL